MVELWDRERIANGAMVGVGNERQALAIMA